MNIWTAIVIIVVVGAVSRILIAAWIKNRHHQTLTAAEDLEAKLERLEQRMANIETIILDREKADRFSQL